MGRGRSESLAGHLHRESQQMATKEGADTDRRDAYTSLGRTGGVRFILMLYYHDLSTLNPSSGRMS